MTEFTLRKAERTDAAIIRRLVHAANLNPTGLNWQRFILAEAPDSTVIGFVQRKPHREGLIELASLVVVQEWRGKGVARALIEAGLDAHDGPLFLMCRADLGVFYQRFGFEALEIEAMPPYFQRIARFAGGFQKLTRRSEGLLVMRKES
jgi:N-acetylglutamate synthase-like GNAT family acetyltransferase